MRSTSKNGTMLNEKLALSTPELMQVLSCGKQTAISLGSAAGARIVCGKRVLWNSSKLREYLDMIAE